MILDLNKTNCYKYKDTTLQFVKLNANMLGISTSINPVVYNDSVVIGDIKLKKGDKIKVNFKSGMSSMYTFNYCIRDKTTLFYDLVLMEDMQNKSVQYLLPMLGKNFKFFSVNKRLMNVYLSEDKNFLFLKYRFINSSEFIKFDSDLQKHPLYRGDSHPDKTFIAYRFRIPVKYSKDINLILEGKYSKVSDDLKKSVLKFYDTDKSSHLGGVLYKTKERRSFLENLVGCNVPDSLDLDDKPNLQLELWKD
jgi:hypothetical protein